MAVDNPKEVDEGATSPKPPNGGDRTGLTFTPYFTTSGVHPYDLLEWERRDAVIYNEKGDVIFKQEQVEVPADWTQLATDIAASKYFRKAGVPGGRSRGQRSPTGDPCGAHPSPRRRRIRWLFCHA